MAKQILTQAQEDKLCLILRAWVEEFGANSVVVSVPLSWQVNCLGMTLGKVALQFITRNRVVVAVPGHLRYEQELAN